MDGVMTSERSGSERSVVSNSTILILSVFLVGVASGGMGGSEFSAYVLDCGLAGLVAYLGLEVAENRRRSEALQQEQKIVESRLDRHVKPVAGLPINVPSSPPRHLRVAEFSQPGVRAD